MKPKEDINDALNKIQNNLHVSEYLREMRDRAFGSTMDGTMYFFSANHSDHRISMKVPVKWIQEKGMSPCMVSDESQRKNNTF